MLILISPAKTFAPPRSKRSDVIIHPATPAHPIVEHALCMNEEALRRDLKLSPALAPKARQAWLRFVEADHDMRAVLDAYSGMVFQKIDARSFSSDDWAYAEDHLAICSFVYGLLRPSHGIRPYRMEGSLRLKNGQRVFDYWRDEMTARFLERIKATGGTLIYLASEEMKQLFHWDIVEQEAKIITPNFLTRQADGSLKTIVIYCKMARGAMTRLILQGRLTDEDALRALTPEGFIYRHELSQGNEWTYILG